MIWRRCGLWMGLNPGMSLGEKRVIRSSETEQRMTLSLNLIIFNGLNNLADIAGKITDGIFNMLIQFFFL